MAAFEVVQWLASLVVSFSVQPTTVAVLGIASFLFVYRQLGRGGANEKVKLHKNSLPAFRRCILTLVLLQLEFEAT